MPEDPNSLEYLSLLRRFDTPTVCNVIELFDVRPRNEGFMDQQIKACFPRLRPIVGYATTATFRSARKREQGDVYSGLVEQVRRMLAEIEASSGWSKDGGRCGGEPAENLARMAHIYARLWQATQNPLHHAKAESLLSVVLAAQDPRTGDIPMGLARGKDGAPRLKPDHPAVRYGIMLRDLLGAADALGTTQ